MRRTEVRIEGNDDVVRAEAASITLAICTNKLARYLSNIETNARLRGPQDRALCVVDEDTHPRLELLERLKALSIEVIVNNKNTGLSYSRNTALGLCQTRHLLFLDDDITVTPEGLTALRQAILSGAKVAGMRLAPPAALNLDKWCITPCQWHYLALHRNDRPASVWGACMLIDVDAARRCGVQFQANLGRKGAQLQSGDDTNFIRRLQRMGPTIVFDDHYATHHIDPDRLRFRYMLRRAYWQGVSEFRRHSPISGLAKEIRRNFDFRGVSIRRLALGTVYIGAVALGVIAGGFQSLLLGAADD